MLPIEDIEASANYTLKGTRDVVNVSTQSSPGTHPSRDGKTSYPFLSDTHGTSADPWEEVEDDADDEEGQVAELGATGAEKKRIVFNGSSTRLKSRGSSSKLTSRGGSSKLVEQRRPRTAVQDGRDKTTRRTLDRERASQLEHRHDTEWDIHCKACRASKASRRMSNKTVEGLD